MKKLALTTGAALLACGLLAPGQAARAQPGGVNAGILTCRVASGWGFVFGSSRNLRCEYSKPGYTEDYYGRISKFGLDIGYLRGGVMVWTVIAPTARLAPGSLTGNYAGVTASATAGIGAGANVLVGGFHRSVMLQPLSIEGNTGLNVAAGIASLSLHYADHRQATSRAK
jgi:hypothetical protein